MTRELLFASLMNLRSNDLRVAEDFVKTGLDTIGTIIQQRSTANEVLAYMSTASFQNNNISLFNMKQKDIYHHDSNLLLAKKRCYPDNEIRNWTTSLAETNKQMF